MSVDVKINITVQCCDLKASIILGPSEKATTTEEEILKKMIWPYNYSNNSALLPEFSPNRELALVTT